MSSKIRRIHNRRSGRAQAIDESLRAPIAPTAEDWIRSPNRYDYPNVDTPKRSTKKRTKKATTTRRAAPKRVEGLTMNQVTGSAFKKEVGFKRAIKRYHNKNKSGGNFGFTLIDKNDKWYDLHGFHDTNKKVSNVRFGKYSETGSPISTSSLSKMMKGIKIEL